MMKTLTPIFMILAIIAGLTLALTPFVADKFPPVSEHHTPSKARSGSYGT